MIFLTDEHRDCLCEKGKIKKIIMKKLFNKYCAIVLSIIWIAWKGFVVWDFSLDSLEGQREWVINVSFVDFFMGIIVMSYFILVLIFSKKD